METKPVIERGMEENSSDDEEVKLNASNRKRIANDAASTRSGKTSTSRYTAGDKGIHRPVGASDAGKLAYTGGEYASKQAKSDMKKKGKVDLYAYIPLSSFSLNGHLPKVRVRLKALLKVHATENSKMCRERYKNFIKN